MGAQIESYVCLTHTLAGEMRSFGSMQVPRGSFETLVSTGPRTDTGPLLLEAEDTLVLWDRDASPIQDWYCAMVEIVGDADAFAYLAWQSKESPTGTKIVWDQTVLYGRVPHLFGSRNSRTNTTEANHANDDSGVPYSWGTGHGEEAGFIYKLMMKNPGTTDLTVRAIFLG